MMHVYLHQHLPYDTQIAYIYIYLCIYIFIYILLCTMYIYICKRIYIYISIAIDKNISFNKAMEHSPFIDDLVVGTY